MAVKEPFLKFLQLCQDWFIKLACMNLPIIGWSKILSDNTS